MDDNGVAKLCDFGLVRLADWQGPAGMTTTSPYTGTERYKAPELFMSKENRHPVATFEGDIYSLGSVMLEVSNYSGHSPLLLTIPISLLNDFVRSTGTRQRVSLGTP